MSESTFIQATYDYRLVALSIVIAIFASYAALDLAARVTAARNTSRLVWLFGGAIAMGTGIWSMHYTGMLAYRLPVPVYYHIPTVALSLVAAIGASLIALFVISRERISGLHVLAGSVLMAGGISGMHYTGMAAMRLPAMHHYDSGLVMLSVAIAALVSLAALALTFLFREEKSATVPKALCAIIMGFAVPAMHYTAMAAVSYMPMKATPDLSLALDISALGNAAIIAATFVILAAVFLLPLWSSSSPRNTAIAQPGKRQAAAGTITR